VAGASRLVTLIRCAGHTHDAMQQLRGAGLDPWQFNPWKQRCSGLLGLRAHRA